MAKITGMSGATPARPKPEDNPSCLSMVIRAIFLVLLSGVHLGIPTVYMSRQLSQEVLLRYSDVVVAGRIIDQRIKETNDSTSYYVTYQYDIPLPQGKRQQFTKTESVSAQTYKGLEFGGQVMVRYAPVIPEISGIQSEPGKNILFLGGVLIFWVSFDSIVIIAGVRSLWSAWKKAQALSRQGQLTQATICDRWIETNDDETKHCVAYHFEVPLPNGGLQRITTAEYSEWAYQCRQIGDRVSVLYLPHKPEVCRLE